MFYAEIIASLKNAPDITATVTVYSDEPSIFSNSAPEEAEKPYIIVRIESSTLPGKVIQTGNLFIDYYDYDKSRVTADAAEIAIQDLLDTNILQTAQLKDLRFSLSNFGYIPEGDSREIHHNLTFSYRGGRSGWGNRTKTP